jgi:4-hydroxy-tetrahydrodipicolinate synthase
METFLKGTFTALITPMDESFNVDYEGYKQLLDIQMETGINGLVPVGTTGESATLSHETHREVIKFVIDYVKENASRFGRSFGEDLFVMPGAGSNCTEEAIELTKYAESVGAHATLHVSPYYNKPTMEGMKLHFKMISESTSIPFVIYNIPGRTSKNIDVPTLLEIANYDNAAGVKEASGDVAQIMKVIQKTRDINFSVMSGDDSYTYMVMAAGGKGVISVASNIVPARMVALTKAMLDGDFQTGLDIHYQLLDLFDAQFIETSPGPIKYMMAQAGLPAGPLRPPMCLPTPATQDKLKKVLADYNLMQ